MMRGSNYIKHKEKMILSKYTIRTEAETIFTNKVKIFAVRMMIYILLVAFILVFVGASLMIFYFL